MLSSMVGKRVTFLRETVRRLSLQAPPVRAQEEARARDWLAGGVGSGQPSWLTQRPHARYMPRRKRTSTDTSYTGVHSSAFRAAKNSKQAQRPSHLYSERYLAIKGEATGHLTQATTRMALENIRLSESTQTQRSTCCGFHLCECPEQTSTQRQTVDYRLPTAEDLRVREETGKLIRGLFLG